MPTLGSLPLLDSTGEQVSVAEAAEAGQLRAQLRQAQEKVESFQDTTQRGIACKLGRSKYNSSS